MKYLLRVRSASFPARCNSMGTRINLAVRVKGSATASFSTFHSSKELVMTDLKPFKTKPSSWHISVASEAIAAAQFARCGYDVSVQYGADQPEYDLVIAKGHSLLKVSVKGSQDLGWGNDAGIYDPSQGTEREEGRLSRRD